MMDSELKKSSVRANRLEKKRYEMLMSSFDSAKRNVAVDMKKGQLDFKRRLKRYKDRQREILVTSSGPSSISMEEFVLKQLTRRNHIRPAQQGLRPQTCPHPEISSLSSRNSDSRTVAARTDSGFKPAMATNISTGNSAEDLAEEEEDFAKLTHCRRSKVDLRPCTAWSASTAAESSTTRRSTPSSLKYLQLRGGRLGTPAKQVRYLADEEIEERSTFYRFLLDGYRHVELQRIETLKDRVDEFCGKGGNRRPSSPPLLKAGAMPLHAGVPPIIHQAMRAKIPHINAFGNLNRSKIH